MQPLYDANVYTNRQVNRERDDIFQCSYSLAEQTSIEVESMS